MTVIDDNVKMSEREQIILQEIGDHFETLHWSSVNSSVIPGCECGCGGDMTDWDFEHKQYNEAVENIHKLYEELKGLIKGEGVNSGLHATGENSESL